jgi:hypothetical protein
MPDNSRATKGGQMTRYRQRAADNLGKGNMLGYVCGPLPQLPEYCPTRFGIAATLTARIKAGTAGSDTERCSII